MDALSSISSGYFRTIAIIFPCVDHDIRAATPVLLALTFASVLSQATQFLALKIWGWEMTL
ncbi:hypothetical protein STEG23_033689, partial [Scotinomys teguina]